MRDAALGCVEVGFTLLEIGRRGGLDMDCAREAAAEIAWTRWLYPRSVIGLSVGGYGADPRSLWMVREVRDFLVTVVLVLGDSGADLAAFEFDRETLVLLTACIIAGGRDLRRVG